MDPKRAGLAKVVPDAVEFLQVSRPTVYRLMANGTLPSVKVGGSRRIPWSALLRFAEVEGGGHGKTQ